MTTDKPRRAVYDGATAALALLDRLPADATDRLRSIDSVDGLPPRCGWDFTDDVPAAEFAHRVHPGDWTTYTYQSGDLVTIRRCEVDGMDLSIVTHRRQKTRSSIAEAAREAVSA